MTIPLVVVIILLLIALVIQNPGAKSPALEMSYTEFLAMEPHIRDVVFHGDTVVGHDDKNAPFTATLPHDPAIATRLAQNHVVVLIGAPEESQNWLTTLLVNALPLIVYVFLLTWPLNKVSRSLDALAGRLDRPSPKRE